MKIIENINVQQEKLSSGLSVALRICRQINKSPDEEDIVDFSHVKFVTPTFIMSVLIYIEKSGKNICLDHVEGYLSSVCLDKFGVNSGAMRKSEFAAYLEQFVQKRYIPLIKFPATNDRIEDKKIALCISTTKKMLVDGMGGQYMMVSGDTVYVKTKAGSGYFELPYGIRFEGTIVALRIPYWNEDFEYVNYIE